MSKSVTHGDGPPYADQPIVLGYPSAGHSSLNITQGYIEMDEQAKQKVVELV